MTRSPNRPARPPRVLAFQARRTAGRLRGFAVIALTYGSFGLLLGVLVKGDLEGFFLIIMGGLIYTFLKTPSAIRSRTSGHRVPFRRAAATAAR